MHGGGELVLEVGAYMRAVIRQPAKAHWLTGGVQTYNVEFLEKCCNECCSELKTAETCLDDSVMQITMTRVGSVRTPSFLLYLRRRHHRRGLQLECLAVSSDSLTSAPCNIPNRWKTGNRIDESNGFSALRS